MDDRRSLMKFRGQASRDLDDWYRTGDVKANLEEARRLLNSPRDFKAIIAALTHGKPSFVFPKHPKLRGGAFQNKLRQGYLDAIELALNHHNPPVPIETWWETKDITEFDTKIANHASHVEVTILVPKSILDPNEQPDPADAKLGLTDVTP
jgi:hypothetical protein